MCDNGAWTSMCDNHWGYKEGFVVCRQLGLPATENNENNISFDITIVLVLLIIILIIMLELHLAIVGCTQSDI